MFVLVLFQHEGVHGRGVRGVGKLQAGADGYHVPEGVMEHMPVCNMVAADRCGTAGDCGGGIE